MSNKRILAFSSSRAGNSAFLEDAVPLIKNFLGERPLQIAFIPFASVHNDYEDYVSKVRTALMHLRHTINLVTNESAQDIIEQSDAIMVGGGNTFKLLHDIYEANVLGLIQNKILHGVPYIGWSAGSNIISPTISTTNDMPIIQPKSFKALSFFPFQINPHYFNYKREGFNGETRDQRLAEYMKLNPGIPVIGLPEGTALHHEGTQLKFIGQLPGVLFHTQENAEPSRKEILSDSDLSYLLD